MGAVLTNVTEAFEWTETSREWLIDKPIEVAIYVVVALVLRWVAHRFIDKMTSPKRKTLLTSNGKKNRDTALRDERRDQRRKTIAAVFKSIVSLMLAAWVVLMVLSIIGLNVAPFIASAGILGIAIGWGAQSLVRDFLSGIFMLLEDQYGVGDVVDLGDAVGTVETVGLRVTTVRSVNGTLWYVRNGEVLRVGNHSQGYAVAVLDVSLARPVNVTEASRIVESAAIAGAQDEKISEHLLEQPVMLGVDQTTAYTVTLRVTARVRAGSQWAVQRHLNTCIVSALSSADITVHSDDNAPA
ncbi:mechanosensitive ion channel [Hoyosella rhizosphaerae]|uniref:Mechanosensitive ion channel protein MscS n=1 Tax=Hoyosella rhizosphaerae TaxID=1755582 RepID=A0A916UGA9_9ACTN|nr:mechanosensitive ion channel domain-containing protein [Hoyosella rhizosphaerae]MBN4928118.1 mechanosensitive ion channel [Hoyosella rhizosphaerae]GGC72515.1 mechanosensitive ion channel protein MscS [Hoyosella rhizosphaerae]